MVLQPEGTMYEDSESIANLRLGETIEAASTEYRQKLTAARNQMAAQGNVWPSGTAIQRQVTLAQEASESICQAVYDIWLDLILRRNHGRLSQADENFINTKIKNVAKGQARNITQSAANQPGLPGRHHHYDRQECGGAWSEFSSWLMCRTDSLTMDSPCSTASSCAANSGPAASSARLRGN